MPIKNEGYVWENEMIRDPEDCTHRSSTETGFYDMHGIPIYVGDLIRVKHFKHIRGRRQMWLYFRVARISGFLFVQNWNDLRPDGHQCLLRDCGLDDAEVVAETLDASGKSPIVTFNERPRKKP